MGIKVKMNIDFDKVKKEFLKEINDRVVMAFSSSCKQAVTYAKENKGYITQTGALSASTGFQLYKDGVLIEEYFESSGGEKDREGIDKGKAAATMGANDINAPVVAVIVAGMPYAIYVESKGKDVLSGAILQLPSILNKELDDMFNKTGVSFDIS